MGSEEPPADARRQEREEAHLSGARQHHGLDSSGTRAAIRQGLLEGHAAQDVPRGRGFRARRAAAAQVHLAEGGAPQAAAREPLCLPAGEGGDVMATAPHAASILCYPVELARLKRQVESCHVIPVALSALSYMHW